MSRRAVLLLLAVTLVPMTDLVILAALVAMYAAGLVTGNEAGVVWIHVHVVSHIWTFCTVPLYWAVLARTRGMSVPRKAMWGLAMFWLGTLAQPAFWRHVRPYGTSPTREQGEALPLARASGSSET